MRGQIAIGVGLLLGLAFGLLASATGSPGLISFAAKIEPVGTGFVNLVNMVVIPLVVSLLFTGIARLGDPRRLGKLGAISLSFFWGTTIIAILLGMATMKLVLPLAPPTEVPPAEPFKEAQIAGLVDFLLSLIPRNVFEAAAHGKLLPLIVFTVLFAAAATTLSEERKARLIGLSEAITQVLIRLVHWILFLAPFGVFALAAALTAKTGWAMLQNLAIFVAGVIFALAVFYFGVYIPLILGLGRIRFGKFLKACAKPAAIGASTTSSAAALPALVDSANELQLSPTVSGFVISLGVAINRAGSALFQGAAIVFLASLYHVSIPATSIAGAVLATFFVSMSVTGVPSSSLVTLAPALNVLNVPVAGIGILWGVDRIPDMCRTATQVMGHLGASVIADRLMGGQPPVEETPT